VNDGAGFLNLETRCNGSYTQFCRTQGSFRREAGMSEGFEASESYRQQLFRCATTREGMIRYLGFPRSMSDGPASTDSPTPEPGAGRSTAPRSRPRAPSRRLLVIGAIAVVAVVLSGTVHFVAFRPSPTPSQVAIQFSAARNLANAIADAHGTWLLGAAYGTDSAVASKLVPYGFFDCNVSAFTGPIPFPINLTVPAFDGNLSSGVATVWTFLYMQQSSSSEIVVYVLNGAASIAFELYGPNCHAGGTLNQILGPVQNPVDSSVAIANALKAGGSTFLTQHPRGDSLHMSVVGGEGWVVGWTTCRLSLDAFGWAGNGSAFGVAENETTGAIGPNQTYNGPCGGPPPIAEALGYGTPTLAKELNQGFLPTQGCTFNDYCYTVPITRAALNVTPGDLSLGVSLPNYNGDNGVVGYAILNASGQVVVYANGPGTGAGGGLWTSETGTNDTLLTTTMSLTIDMGGQDPQGVGYVLTTEGWGPSFTLGPYFSLALP
jgi:hypothetical protein